VFLAILVLTMEKSIQVIIKWGTAKQCNKWTANECNEWTPHKCNCNEGVSSATQSTSMACIWTNFNLFQSVSSLWKISHCSTTPTWQCQYPEMICMYKCVICTYSSRHHPTEEVLWWQMDYAMWLYLTGWLTLSSCSLYEGWINFGQFDQMPWTL